MAKPSKLNDDLKIIVSAISGTALTYPYQNSGLGIALHEVVGHGVLGMQLTAHSADPSYWISGFSEFNHVKEAGSIQDKLAAFFSWLFTNPPTENDASGTSTESSQAHPNSLAKYLGQAGTDAWVSIAGSIPGLLVNTACVISGMMLRKKSPKIGSALLLFGLTNSMSESIYAWTAVPMSALERSNAAAEGNDFASFACQMSNITGISASSIALCAALFWTGFLPLLTLGMYLHQKSKLINMIPDEIALDLWLSQCRSDKAKQQVFLDLLQSYALKKDIVLLFNPIEEKFSISPELDEENKTLMLEDLLRYLTKNLPAKIMTQAKKDVLMQWQALQKPSKLAKLATYSSIAVMVTSIAAQVINVLAASIVPALKPLAVALKIACPFFCLLSVAQSAYETTRDLRCPNAQIPRLAKILSIINLISTILLSAVIIASVFTPGMQLLLLPALLSRALLSTVLQFAKFKIIQNQFQKNQPAEAGEAMEEKSSPLKKSSHANRFSFYQESTSATPQDVAVENVMQHRLNAA